jgi:glycosyltransferase involved in cell wall biosynthesis
VRKMLADTRLLMVTAGPIPGGLPLDGIEIIKPTWDRQTITELFASADVFVLPSRLETWGDVLLEAMAHHLPCIGVEGDAMGEIIVDGQTGYVLPQEDVQELILALAALFSDAGRRQEWGAAGRRRVEELFTWDKVVERMAPVLIDACNLAEQIAVAEEYC